MLLMCYLASGTCPCEGSHVPLTYNSRRLSSSSVQCPLTLDTTSKCSLIILHISPLQYCLVPRSCALTHRGLVATPLPSDFLSIIAPAWTTENWASIATDHRFGIQLWATPPSDVATELLIQVFEASMALSVQEAHVGCSLDNGGCGQAVHA